MSAYDFLRVNAFLATEMDARAIKAALELGVVDALNGGAPVSESEFSARQGINRSGLKLLIDMLEANGAVERKGDYIALTQAFKTALSFRDLLESRIDFADLVWPDIHTLFPALLTDLPQFMARSKVFELFRYDRCLTVTPENLRAAAAWTRFTTVLTRYESGPALDAVDLGGVGSFTDLGGNTGEFARQVCARNPATTATVVDLPVVCALGKEHIAAVAETAEAARITFFPADMRSDNLPPPADLVAFKSVLHDWPDADAERLLERGAGLVRPGGRLMIYERGPFETRGKRIAYVSAPDLVFLHFLRPAELYLKKLSSLGFGEIEYRTIDLDIRFHLIVARRPQ